MPWRKEKMPFWKGVYEQVTLLSERLVLTEEVISELR